MNYDINTHQLVLRAEVFDEDEIPERFDAILTSDGSTIGAIAAMPRSDVPSSAYCCSAVIEAEIVHSLPTEYAAEAVQAMLRHCFEQLKCTYVWMKHTEGDAQAETLKQSCGFEHRHSIYNAFRRINEHYGEVSRARWKSEHTA